MAIGMVILSGFIGWATLEVRTARHTEYREQALQIAEAGIDYYRWHLAHAPTDYQDGIGVAGPYEHDYYDKSGNKLGTFTLDIVAPTVGSTLVTVHSTGRVLTDSTVERTLQVKLGKPSFAKFALVTNDDVWEDNVEVFGPYHANGGVHFSNVLAHNIVTSARTTYVDPDFYGTEWGVYTDKPTTTYPTGDPLPPTPFSDRSDVFLAGRVIGVPAVDFTGMMADLATLKASAQLGGGYYAPSGGFGYHIVLKTTGKYDIYKVTSQIPSPNGSCTANYVYADPGGGMWSVQTEDPVLSDVPFPANGVIFTEDDVWVDGTIDHARLTIAAARFPDNPSTRANIIVNNDVRYTNYDGSDSIGLIAQNDFRIGYDSLDTLHIDGAIIAQSGAIWRDVYYNCGPSDIRTKIETNGSLITNQRYTFSWVCGFGFCSGYRAQTSTFDSNMLYGPPPSFPLTSDKYQVLSWDEIIN